ncbi:MAG: hypothetical protein JW932_11855 [Deltaproteobacteria bacterium]|nr:hypothetical protein [Deltaproteobacteria bacterium]
MIKKMIFAVFIMGSMILFNAGCPFVSGKHNVWKPAVPQENHFEHIVKWPGETLKIIAEWYTHDAENWSCLVDANPQINQDNLLKGNIIYIPGHLLKNTKPLPESFMSSYNQKTKPSPRPSIKLRKSTEKPAPAPKPNKEDKKGQDDFELFGPK